MKGERKKFYNKLEIGNERRYFKKWKSPDRYEWDSTVVGDCSATSGEAGKCESTPLFVIKDQVL